MSVTKGVQLETGVSSHTITIRPDFSNTTDNCYYFSPSELSAISGIPPTMQGYHSITVASNTNTGVGVNLYKGQPEVRIGTPVDPAHQLSSTAKLHVDSNDVRSTHTAILNSGDDPVTINLVDESKRPDATMRLKAHASEWTAHKVATAEEFKKKNVLMQRNIVHPNGTTTNGVVLKKGCAIDQILTKNQDDPSFFEGRYHGKNAPEVELKGEKHKIVKMDDYAFLEARASDMLVADKHPFPLAKGLTVHATALGNQAPDTKIDLTLHRDPVYTLPEKAYTHDSNAAGAVAKAIHLSDVDTPLHKVPVAPTRVALKGNLFGSRAYIDIDGDIDTSPSTSAEAVSPEDAEDSDEA